MNSKLMTVKKAIPAALIMAGTLGLSSNVNASAYAISYDNIFDFVIQSTDAAGNCPGCPAGPFNFFVPLTDFTDFTATSSVTANLQGDGDLANPANSASAGGPVDANIAFGNNSSFPAGAPAENSYTAEGQAAGPYSYGDAQVGSTALAQATIGDPVTATGNLTQAWNIAEAFVPTTGFADSAGLNSSETGISTTITLGQAAIFYFDFSADPYMEVAMSADALGGTANANLDVTFSITSGGQTVFAWAPDGAINPGGNLFCLQGGLPVICGTETVDSLDLNGSIEVTSPGDSAVYDPSGNGPPAGNVAPGSFGTFSAQTLVLQPGTYTIAVDMAENVNVRTAFVPEPGVLALLGLGLTGLGFSRRRKLNRK